MADRLSDTNLPCVKKSKAPVKRRKIVLLGARGQLGTAIRTLAPPDWDLICPTREELDLSAGQNLEIFLDAEKPDCLFNASAYNAVETAESDPSIAIALNATAVGRMAFWSRRNRATMIHFSTDYVFPGNSGLPIQESAPTHPINAYGSSKAAGERLFLESETKGCLIRTSAVFGPRQGGPSTHNFIEKILHQTTKNSPFSVRVDLHFSPTCAKHLAQFAIARLEAGDSGIYHCTNRGTTTWFHWAREILSQMNIAPELAVPASGPSEAAANRPRYSVLANTKAFNLSTLTWQEATKHYLFTQTQDA
jgi:dTDP-4-dehydrorhamnose reductase